MSTALTDDQIEEMYQVWLIYKPRFGYKKAFAEVARACRICERTVRKYHRIGEWDKQLEAIQLSARSKLNYNAVEERVKNLKILMAGKAVYAAQLGKGSLQEKIRLKDIVEIVRLEMELAGTNDSGEEKKELLDLQSRYRKAKGIGSS